MTAHVHADLRRGGAALPTLRSSRCRLCGDELSRTVCDLGMAPLCESYVPASRLSEMEPTWPLIAKVCGGCFLVQLDEHVPPETIFQDYRYRSSYSRDWLDHARAYAGDMIRELGLGASSFVVEVGSNDGYLLQYFVRHGVPVLGVDPARNLVEEAAARGVPTLVRFFGRDTAARLTESFGRADLIVANNVLAQAPDLRDFVEGLALLLAPDGLLTFELPHVLRLIEGRQLDSIYHEHYSYFSLLSLERLLSAHGLSVTDVEELWTHGGSLRLFVRHTHGAGASPSERVARLRGVEARAGLNRLETYAGFEAQAREVKRRLLRHLIALKDRGRRIVGYGAPGKGSTLLNYCGIGTDFLDFTVDRNPHKQGLYLPGTHVPILAPRALDEARPDYILVLPHNLREEILHQLDHAREWGARFIIPLPEVAEC